MIGRGKKVIAFFLATIFIIYLFPEKYFSSSGFMTDNLLLQVSATSTQEQLEQAEEEKRQTESLLNQTQDERDDLQQETDSLKGKLNQLNSDLTQVSLNLEELEKAIDDKEEEIVKIGLELDEAKATEASQYESMKQRIRYMYESQDYVIMEMIFAAESFSEFLNKSDYILQLSAYDREQLELYQDNKEKIAQQEQILLTEKQQLDDLKVEVIAEQSKVAGLVSQTSGSIAQYQNQISATETKMLELEQQINSHNENIAELKKKIEEEKRLAALAAQSAWRDLSEVQFVDGDRYLLANIIYCEAGNQPYAGQVAVGAVVMNRVMSSLFPDTVVGVIYQNKQFSPVASGRLALALAENRATAACYKAADEAMAGATTVGNCLFFRTPIEGLTGQQIGGHIFY